MKKNNIEGQLASAIELMFVILQEMYKCQQCCACKNASAKPTYEEYTDTADTCKILKVTPTTLWRYRKKGLIEFVKRGSKIMYRVSSFFKRKK